MDSDEGIHIEPDDVGGAAIPAADTEPRDPEDIGEPDPVPEEDIEAEEDEELEAAGFGIPVTQQISPVVVPTPILISVTVKRYAPRWSSMSLRTRSARSRESWLVKVITKTRRRSRQLATKRMRVAMNSRNSVNVGGRNSSVDCTHSSFGIGNGAAGKASETPNML